MAKKKLNKTNEDTPAQEDIKSRNVPEKDTKGMFLKSNEKLAKCNKCTRLFKSKADVPQCKCGSREITILSGDSTKSSQSTQQTTQQKDNTPAVEIGNISVPLTPEDVVMINNMKKDGRYGANSSEIIRNSLNRNIQTTNLGDSNYGGQNMNNQQSNGNPVDEIQKFKTMYDLVSHSNANTNLNTNGNGSSANWEQMKAISDILKDKSQEMSPMIKQAFEMKQMSMIMKAMGMDDNQNNSQQNQLLEFQKRLEEEKRNEQFQRQIEQMRIENQRSYEEFKRTLEIAAASGKQFSPTELLVNLQNINNQNQQAIEKIRGEAETAKQQLLATQLQNIQTQLATHQSGINTGQFTPNGVTVTSQIAGLKDTITAVKEVAKEFVPQAKEESTMEQAGKVLGQAIEQINPTVIAPIGAAIAQKIAQSGNKPAQLPQIQQPTPQQTYTEPEEVSLAQVSTGD